MVGSLILAFMHAVQGQGGQAGQVVEPTPLKDFIIDVIFILIRMHIPQCSLQ